MGGALAEAVYFVIASRTSGGNSSSSAVVDGGVTGVAGGSATGCACTRAGCGSGEEDRAGRCRAAHPARSAPVSSAAEEEDRARERVVIQQAPFNAADYSLLQLRFVTHTPSGLR